MRTISLCKLDPTSAPEAQADEDRRVRRGTDKFDWYRARVAVGRLVFDFIPVSVHRLRQLRSDVNVRCSPIRVTLLISEPFRRTVAETRSDGIHGALPLRAAAPRKGKHPAVPTSGGVRVSQRAGSM